MNTKPIITILLLILLTSATSRAASSNGIAAKAKTLEVTFNYNRQNGPGSNQYAVWIEDEQGRVVKTLFVTSFTTKGRPRPGEAIRRGYTFRPTCVPSWVKAVKAEERTDAELDAYTGATPQSGTQTFTWDLTDQAGKRVKKGNYTLRIEATLINDRIVTYTGLVRVGSKPSDVPLTQSLAGNDTSHDTMITDVKASLK